jgi:hypothetical protein
MGRFFDTAGPCKSENHYTKMERNFKQEKALAQIAAYARRMSVPECFLVVFHKEMTNPDLVGERTVLEYEGLKVNLIWL